MALVSVLATVFTLEALARLASYVLAGRTTPGQVELRYFPFLETVSGSEEQRILGPKRSSIGFSERMRAAQAPKGGRYRVVVLGASTAIGLPDQLLASRIRELRGREVEVINLAFPAYIVNQEVVMLGLFGLNLQPDLVISLDGTNDPVSASKTWKPGLPISATALGSATRSPLLYALASIGRRSQLITLALKWRERRAEREFQSRRDLVESTMQQYLQGVRALSIMARGTGAEHVMVLQPYLYLRRSPTAEERTLGLARLYDYRSRFMMKYLRELGARMRGLALAPGVHFVDATAAFDESTETCFTDEVHLTARGYELLVDTIVSHLKQPDVPAAASVETGRWPLELPPGNPAAQVIFRD